MKRKPSKKVRIELSPEVAKRVMAAAYEAVCSMGFPHTTGPPPPPPPRAIRVRLKSNDAYALAQASGKKLVPKKRRKKSTTKKKR